MKRYPASLDIGEVVNKLDLITFPHRLKLIGWTIIVEVLSH